MAFAGLTLLVLSVGPNAKSEPLPEPLCLEGGLVQVHAGLVLPGSEVSLACLQVAWPGVLCARRLCRGFLRCCLGRPCPSDGQAWEAMLEALWGPGSRPVQRAGPEGGARGRGVLLLVTKKHLASWCIFRCSGFERFWNLKENIFVL